MTTDFNQNIVDIYLFGFGGYRIMTTDCRYFYLIFIMWSSWFPLLMYISFGYNKKLANKMTTISIELFPLSTKSPLKIYGLSTEGRPFWNKLYIELFPFSTKFPLKLYGLSTEGRPFWNKFYIELFLPVYKITIEDIWIINRKKDHYISKFDPGMLTKSAEI